MYGQLHVDLLEKDYIRSVRRLTRHQSPDIGGSSLRSSESPRTSQHSLEMPSPFVSDESFRVFVSKPLTLLCTLFTAAAVTTATATATRMVLGKKIQVVITSGVRDNVRQGMLLSSNCVYRKEIFICWYTL